jgi:hypothetical protein
LSNRADAVFDAALSSKLKMAELMRMKLADQSACGILESLIARLVFENRLED